MTELTDMLPSAMFHIGGDEVQYQCWESSPKIVAYLAKRNMTGVQLYQEFEYRMYVGPCCCYYDMHLAVTSSWLKIPDAGSTS